MKTTEIKNNIKLIDVKIRKIISEKGPTEMSNILDLKKQDISDYKNKRKPWSYKKILDVGEKLGL
jgi:hypothetical protein